MKDSMSKTSGNLQNELAQRDDEINKLSKKIQELDREILRLKKQISDEVDSKEQMKKDFEKRIKDLED